MIQRLCAALLTVLALLDSAGAATPAARTLTINPGHVQGEFNRFYRESIGSDYAGSLSREENLRQLERTVKELGFRHVRMHAIFHDHMQVFKLVDGKPQYDWTRIDAMYDRLLKMGIKPFVELGFTPLDMATSKASVFYYEGNISHPKPELWVGLVDAFVRHLRERYGAEEVRSWYFEVWNEPDLTAFWENADRQAYFELYDRTARAIKAIDPTIRVGGPATSGTKFIAPFIAFTEANKTPIDFISHHSYGVDGGFLDLTGKADWKLATEPYSMTNVVVKGYLDVKASAKPHLPLILSEFNASWVHRDPLLDSYLIAPFILSKIQENQGMLAMMSFWTFTDLFEEMGPPPSSFHGGFGLLNREGIRKSSYFAYKYLQQLHDIQLKVSDDAAFVTAAGDDIAAVIWDYQPALQTKSNRSTHYKVFPTRPAAPAVLKLQGMKPGSYSVSVRRTGFRANDPYTAYLEMGSPKDLTTAQIEQLNRLTDDRTESVRRIEVGRDGKAVYQLPMRANDVVLVQIQPLGATGQTTVRK
jgi:xylan 1,4-beta-xylosidase